MRFSVPIKNNYEFRRVYNKGKSAATSCLVVYCRPYRTADRNRLGITVGTKIGKAVIRNKIRRRIKEIYRLNEEKLKSGYDIVIVARVRSRDAMYRELERDILRLFTKLGVVKDEKDTDISC